MQKTRFLPPNASFLFFSLVNSRLLALFLMSSSSVCVSPILACLHHLRPWLWEHSGAGLHPHIRWLVMPRQGWQRCSWCLPCSACDPVWASCFLASFVSTGNWSFAPFLFCGMFLMLEDLAWPSFPRVPGPISILVSAHFSLCRLGCHRSKLHRAGQ